MGLLQMRKLYQGSIIALSAFCFAKTGGCYTTVTFSAAAPASLEASFIASTTSQYKGTVSSNPFFANTFSVKLDGLNPAYSPPIQKKDLLDALVTVDSYTYVSGWGNGESYQQYQDAILSQQFAVQCSTPSVFVDTSVFTSPWDPGTCIETLNRMYQTIYQLHLSTPTIVPGEWQ